MKKMRAVLALAVSVDTGTFAPTPAYQAWDNFANAANTASGNPLSEVGGNGSPLFGLGPVWTPSRDERMPLIIS